MAASNIFSPEETVIRTVRPDPRDVLEVGVGKIVTNVGARTIQYDEASDFASPTNRTTGQAVTTTVPIFVRVTAGQGRVSIEAAERTDESALDARLDTIEGGGWLTGSEVKDFASVADGAFASEDVTVTGAALGDAVVDVSSSVAIPAGATLTGQVTATDTVTTVLQNESGGAVDLASTTIRVVVRKV